MVHRKTVGLGLTGLSMVFLSILFILPYVKIFFPVVSGFMDVDTVIEKANLKEAKRAAKEAKKAAAARAEAEMRMIDQQKREAAVAAAKQARNAKRDADVAYARQQGENEMEGPSQEELERVSRDRIYEETKELCSMISQ
jgi:hypothetical protein